MADIDLLTLGHVLGGGIEAWRSLSNEGIREHHFEGRGQAIYAWIVDRVDSGARYPDIGEAESRFEIPWPVDNGIRFKDLLTAVRERRTARLLEEAVTGVTTALKRGEVGRAKIIWNDTQVRVQAEESSGIEVRSLTALGPEVEARYENTVAGVGGIELPWATVTRMVGRLMPGSVLGLIARPSIGKTTVSLTIASHAWRIGGHTILYISPEMAAVDLAESFFAITGNIPFSKMVLGELTPDQRGRLKSTVEDLMAQDGLYVIDATDGLTPERIRAAILKVKPTLIIVDSFYELFPEMKGHQEMAVRLDYTTAWLKEIARMNGGIPVVANSQLKRGVGDASDATGDDVGMSDRIMQRFQAVFKLWKKLPDDEKNAVIRIGPLKIRRLGEWKAQVLLTWCRKRGTLIEVESHAKDFKDDFSF